MDVSKLDAFSKKYADFLFGKRPDWKKFASVEDEHKNGNFSLLIEIPCPSMKDSPFTICTADGEISLYWDYFHEHSFGETDEECFQESLQTIDAIMNEALKVAAWTLNGKWIGSTSIESNEEPDDFPDFLQKTPDTLIIRSWKGTYNSEKKF